MNCLIFIVLVNVLIGNQLFEIRWQEFNAFYIVILHSKLFELSVLCQIECSQLVFVDPEYNHLNELADIDVLEFVVVDSQVIQLYAHRRQINCCQLVIIKTNCS